MPCYTCRQILHRSILGVASRRLDSSQKCRALNNDQLSLHRMLPHGSYNSYQDDAFAALSSHAQWGHSRGHGLGVGRKTNWAAKNKNKQPCWLGWQDLVEIEDLDNVKIKAINLKSIKSGRQPFRRPSHFAGSKGKGGKGKSSGDKSAEKCRLCLKEGHMQQECYSWINKNAPVSTGTESQQVQHWTWLG